MSKVNLKELTQEKLVALDESTLERIVALLALIAYEADNESTNLEVKLLVERIEG